MMGLAVVSVRATITMKESRTDEHRKIFGACQVPAVSIAHRD